MDLAAEKSVHAVLGEVERRLGSRAEIELSILMPCLNEAETLAVCIAKATGFLHRSRVAGEVIVADNGSTDASRDIARALGHASSRSRRAATARRSAPASRRRAAATSSWATPTTPMTSRARRLPCQASPGRGPRHGQPLQGRHCRSGDAAAPPLSRQPGAVLHRPAVLPQPDRRLSLRAERLRARRDPRPAARRARHGVRLRDGRQGDARRPQGRRGADDAEARRALAAAAPQQLARRLAPPEAAPHLRAALAVPVSRRRRSPASAAA